jgi:hypothetical protein
VLVRGAAHRLDTEAERAPIIDARLPPWTEGEPEHFIRVNPTGIWGTASAGHDATGGVTRRNKPEHLVAKSVRFGAYSG